MQPSDNLLSKLNSLPIDFYSGVQSQTIATEIDRVQLEIEEIDYHTIEVIGKHMEAVNEAYDRCIESTKKLFTALAKLKEEKHAAIDSKKSNLISSLQKLEYAVGCVNKSLSPGQSKSVGIIQK